MQTEEFPFGWDPDEGPLPVSDTLCYPKGLMFLPLQAWGGAQVPVPGHVPSELGGQHACWSCLQAGEGWWRAGALVYTAEEIWHRQLENLSMWLDYLKGCSIFPQHKFSMNNL